MILGLIVSKTPPHFNPRLKSSIISQLPNKLSHLMTISCHSGFEPPHFNPRLKINILLTIELIHQTCVTMSCSAFSSLILHFTLCWRCILVTLHITSFAFSSQDSSKTLPMAMKSGYWSINLIKGYTITQESIALRTISI